MTDYHMCHVIGIGGDCGVNCEVYKHGNCPEPEGVEDIMTTKPERPDLNHLKRYASCEENGLYGGTFLKMDIRWLLYMLKEVEEHVVGLISERWSVGDDAAERWLAKYRGEDGE